MNESSARYDSNEDADYEPIGPEDSDDELEFNNSDASTSEDSEEEVLVKEEPVEEDARILELFIYLTLVLSCRCLPQRSDILLNDSIVHRKTF